jgi:hypothetical protein
MMLTYDNPTEGPELVVFNTLIPQDDPSNSRRFSLPLGPYDQYARIYIDHNRHLGTPGVDEPLVADPAQAIFVMEFLNSRNLFVLVVARTQALIDHACSPRADSHVPWDEWGKGAVFMEVPEHRNPISTFVHGTKVMVREPTDFRPGHPSYRIYTFDFSLRGRSSLKLVNEEGGRTERVASFEDALGFEVEASEGMSLWDSLESLGDGNLFYLASRFYRSIGTKVVG